MDLYNGLGGWCWCLAFAASENQRYMNNLSKAHFNTRFLEKNSGAFFIFTLCSMLNSIC